MSEFPEETPDAAAESSEPSEPVEPMDPRTRESIAKLMRPKNILRELSLAFALSLALILGLVLLGNIVPLVQQNLYVLVASVFVGIPYFWLRHVRADFEHFGLTYARAGRGILWGLLVSVLTMLPFAFGYAWWQQNFLGNELDFSSDNFYQWPLEIKGRPAGWEAISALPGHRSNERLPGVGEGKVWLWTQDATLRVGLATGSGPVDVYLQADTPLKPVIRGGAKQVEGHHTDATRSTFRLEQSNARSELVFKRAKDQPLPRSLKIHAKNLNTGDSIAVFQGPKEARSSGVLNVGRGLTWLLLWLMTELMFIALPEEFFYRGYLLTRLKHFFDMRALDRQGDEETPTKPAPPKRRRILGVSMENLIVSLLFAVGHVLIPIGGVLLISRAAVFFPSLAFGWLRERTGSIVAPVVYHAAANMMVLLAAPHFF